MGVVDVVFFIFIKNVMMDEVVFFFWEIGEKVVGFYYFFVFFYEKLVIVFYCENLVVVCKGEFEGMVEKMKLFEWYFDYGFVGCYFIVGVVVIGVCMLLVVYNINLSIDNFEIVIKIVKNICYINGGLCYVKVMGVELKEWNIIQVFINIIDYICMVFYCVFELVCIEVCCYGVIIFGSEIVGFVLMEVLIDIVFYYFGLENFFMW